MFFLLTWNITMFLVFFHCLIFPFPLFCYRDKSVSFAGDSCCFSFSLGKIQQILEDEIPGVYVHSIRIGNNEIEVGHNYQQFLNIFDEIFHINVKFILFNLKFIFLLFLLQVFLYLYLICLF